VSFSGEPNNSLKVFLSRLTCQDVLFETEHTFFTAELQIGPEDLPKYIPSQSFAAVARARENFFFLQCRTRGARLTSTKTLYRLFNGSRR
jgi:hypothetical protein